MFWSIFFTTFVIGCLVFSFTKIFLFDSPEVNPIKEQTVETNSPMPQFETIFQPKIFKLHGIEEDFENQENKHFIEAIEVSNGEDFKIKSGEIWLGLFGKNNDYNLRQTKVRLRNSTYESGLDWTDISVKSKEKPLFLVKNLKSIGAGKVNTLFRGNTLNETDENIQTTEIGKGFFREFKLGEKVYTLRVEQGLSEDQKPIAVLILQTGGESQIIDFVWVYDDYVSLGSLYWVGDLDNDGKLDLYKDFWNYEKGYYLSGLFLSSEAKKGQLVKRFEFLAYGGC